MKLRIVTIPVLPINKLVMTEMHISIQYLPWIDMDYSKGKPTLMGTLVEFAKTLSRKLNCSYELLRPRFLGFENLVTHIHNNESDITLNPIFQTTSRSTKISFSKPIFYSAHVILSKARDRIIQNDLLDYIWTVDPRIWLTLYLVISVLIFFTALRKFVIFRPNQKNKISVWKLIRVLLYQAHFKQYSLNWWTLLITIFSISYLILIQLFNALINLQMVVKETKRNINSLQDIYNGKDIVPSIYKNSLVETYFKEMPGHVWEEIWNRIDSNRDISIRSSTNKNIQINYPENAEKYIGQLMDGRVVNMELGTNQKYIKHLYCQQMPQIRWHVSKSSFYSILSSFGLNKNLDKSIIVGIDKLIDTFASSGIGDKLSDSKHFTQIITQDMMECLTETRIKKTNFTPIHIITLNKLFCVIIIMVILSIELLVIELFYKKYCSNKLFKKSKKRKLNMIK